MGPADAGDAGEIAASDQVKKQVVTFDQAAWAAGFHSFAERPVSAVVARHFYAGKRHAIVQIDAYLAATRIFDLAQRSAITGEFQAGQIFAEAIAPPTVAARIARAAQFL